jgi:hypothetical protein
MQRRYAASASPSQLIQNTLAKIRHRPRLRADGAVSAAVCFRRRGVVVGGEEQFQRQFGQHHIDRRAEHRGHAEEGQHARTGLDPERHRDLVFDIGRLSRTIGRRRVGAHFTQKIDQRAIGGQLDLAAQAIQQMRPPFGEIDDARREPLRMQREPHRIQWRLQEIGGDPFVQFRQRRIASDDAPLPVERKGRIGLLTLQHEIDRAAGGGQRRVGQRPLREHRRIARGHQEHVALAHRHVELF